MITLEQIREKYPTAHYPPDPECRKCKGAGEWWDERSGHFFKPGMRCCVCIFVEHSFAPEAAKLLGEFARKELGKMRRGGSDGE